MPAGVKLKSMVNKGFDPGAQCVALKTMLDNGTEFYVLIPRGIVGTVVASICAALADAPDVRAEIEGMQAIRFQTVAAGLHPDGRAVLYFDTQEKIRIAMTMTAENLPGIQAAIGEIDRLLAPQSGAAH